MSQPRKGAKMYLISPNKKQYKANLHCHSVLSDGKKTPAELKEMYKQKGYSILTVTDHEIPKSHSEISDQDFMMLTGYECYIRKTPSGKYDTFEEEVHLNLFARKPENEAIVCYNDCYCKYLSKEAKDALIKVGSQKPREYTREYINEYIRIARENGYIVAYNHPYWSMEKEENILFYEGLFSMEMCNYSSYLMNHLEYNGTLYDKLLRSGKKIFCHSADDNHNKYPEDTSLCDSFGAFTMIIPEEFTYDGVIEAMERGNMYSSMGPLFKEISLDGDRIHIECSEVEQIVLYSGSKVPKYVRAEDGQSITAADFVVPPHAK